MSCTCACTTSTGRERPDSHLLLFFFFCMKVRAFDVECWTYWIFYAAQRPCTYFPLSRPVKLRCAGRPGWGVGASRSPEMEAGFVGSERAQVAASDPSPPHPVRHGHSEDVLASVVLSVLLDPSRALTCLWRIQPYLAELRASESFPEGNMTTGETNPACVLWCCLWASCLRIMQVALKLFHVGFA